MPEESRDIDVALRNREFEIQLFWQRTNYFLVLITALGVGVFSANKPFLGFLMSSFATLTCWLWFRTNLGSRFWQIFWEDEVESLASEYHLESFLKTTPNIKEKMRSKQANEKNRGMLRNWIDAQVLSKPSVTYHMILLSFAALIFWAFVTLYFGIQLLHGVFKMLFGSC